MKKILFINCSDVGSTGKIIHDTADIIKNYGWISILCVPRITVEPTVKTYSVCSKLEQGVYHKVSSLTGHRFAFAPLSTKRIINAIKKEKPDIVHIHCTNGNMVHIYKLFSFLKKNHYPTVVTNHAEFFYTGTCDHANECDRWLTGCGNCPQGQKATQWNWNIMKAAFSGFDKIMVTSVSPWVLSRSIRSPILEGIPQCVVRNGVDPAVFKPYDTLESPLKLAGKNKIIFCAMSYFYGDSDQKGSKYIVELAKRFLDEAVIFLIAGPHPENVNVPSNVVLLGYVSDQYQLARYYSIADLSLSTGKRETFGMCIAESLCCGTPIIGFAAGGPESIALSDETAFCSFGDVDEMELMIRNKWLTYKASTSLEKRVTSAVAYYSKETMADAYLEIYNKLTKNDRVEGNDYESSTT